MKPHMTNTDDPIDFPKEAIEPILLDPGCAERGCMGYSPQFGDTECEEYFPATYVYELQQEIAELEKQNDRLLTIAEDFKLVIEQYKKQNAELVKELDLIRFEDLGDDK